MPECWMDSVYEDESCILELKTLAEDRRIYLLHGPWTNLAQRLLQHPSFKNEVDQVIVLGGSCPSECTVANPDIEKDPEAAEYVIRSGIPVTVLTDEVLARYGRPLEAVRILLREPHRFCVESCGLHVETRSRLCRGLLISDVHSDQKFKDRNCTLVTLICYGMKPTNHGVNAVIKRTVS